MFIKISILKDVKGIYYAIYPFHIFQYRIRLLLSVAEESLDVAHHAAEALVDFSVDGIVDNLICFCPCHLLDHWAAWEMLGHHVYALVNKIVDRSVNRSIYGEVASLLHEIRILVLVHILVLLLLHSI